MSEENSTTPATVEASSPEEVFEKANELKTSGNTFFKNKQYQEAYNAYTNAINLFITSGVEFKKLTKTPQLQQCLDQLSACHTNIALCFLKCDQNEQGIHFATNALKYDNRNSKAFYLRGKMLRLEGELQQAKRDMQMCLMIQPENEEAQQEIEAIEKEIQDELQRRRALLDDDSDEESSDPSGMINPQVLRMLRSMNLGGGGFNPMMFRGMGGMKSSEEMYQEELEKAIKLSIAEEEDRKKKEDEEKRKAEELQKQQDEMKQFFEEQEKKRKEAIEAEQTPVEESIDEPFEVELDEEEEEEGGDEGEAEEEEGEGEEGEEEFDIDEADLDNLEEYKPEEEQGQEAD